MTLGETRASTVTSLEAQIDRLERDLAKKRQEHEALQQKLFEICKKEITAAEVEKTEEIKKQLSESMTDIRHLDARISKVKHRLQRFMRSP